MIAEALRRSAALQHSNLQVRTPLVWIRDRITCESVVYLHLPFAGDMGIPYCMASVFLAYKHRNPFPILFSLSLRTHPPHAPPRVELRVVPAPCSGLQVVNHVRHPLTGR
jgi:hypothetical protein